MRSKKDYKFISHTADVEFIAFGSTREECFKNALMAMFETTAYTSKLSKLKSKDHSFIVKDRAKKLEDLLWYAMQDTLSISDSKEIFAYKVNGIEIKQKDGKYSIKFKVIGKQKQDDVSKLEVKGVARYNLGIKNTKKGLEATVVLDV